MAQIRKGKSVKKFKLTILLLSCFLLAPHAARADVPIGACYIYNLFDGFEGTSASQWSPWNASSTGAIKLGMTGSARTGSSAALLSFNRREPIGGFLLIDKLLNVNNSSTSSRIPRHGCLTVPWPPVGQPKYCSASVWIKPAAGGASGAVQLIDPSSWAYLASKSFNYVGSGSWVNVATDVVSGCGREVVARIVLSRDTTTSEAMVADDVQITWYF
jgi:hypothetical protein